jgi:DNA mismatch repair protein MutS
MKQIHNTDTKDEDTLLDSASPMIKQYLIIKQEHKDHLLFYRMGDFYELFFDDASLVANLLGIVLTKRGTYNNQPINMCGVPVHSYNTYINRLIKLGFKVAIAEQTETPEQAQKRTGKSSKVLINREVVRIISAGTLVEEELLEGNEFNYLLCLYKENKKTKEVGIAYIDISTGDFWTKTILINEIVGELLSINPSEIIIQDNIDNDIIPTELLKITTKIPAIKFNLISTKELLKNTFINNSYILNNLSSFETIACGVLLDYIQLTQKTTQFLLPPKKNNSNLFLKMDFFTFKSLELIRSYNGNTLGSLKYIIDKCNTSLGSRLLSSWLMNPSCDIKEINTRLSIVDFFVNNFNLCENIFNILKKIPDIDRVLGRISFNKGSVSDLYLVRNFLNITSELKFIMLSGNSLLKDFFIHLDNDSLNYNQILDTLNKALQDNLPHNYKEEGFVKNDYSATLYLNKKKLFECYDNINNLQQNYIQKTQINTLKITHSNNWGYCVEVSNKNADKINQFPEFIYKGSLVSNIRYKTQDLQKTQEEILFYNDLKNKEEAEIFNQLIKEILLQKEVILNLSKIIAYLDILVGFAKLSVETNLVKPNILEEGSIFDVKDARHLVVEQGLKKQAKAQFTGNSCVINEVSEKSIFLITGPNMAGKSTYLRQNALIVVMAQIGCFVPASSATISLVDALYSRVGASDDLFKGQSTFMVEMQELATILNNATEKSFVILDEIGRGTSTYDGIAIAYASVEYINNHIKCRTLFATHYHELTELENTLDRVECYFVNVFEENGKIVFLHNVLKGVASKSYGVKVAQLAGLPQEVIKNATKILNKFDVKNTNNNLDLFDIALLDSKNETNTINSNNRYDEIIKSIKNTSPDNLSPKEALEVVYNLKELIKKI